MNNQNLFWTIDLSIVIYVTNVVIDPFELSKDQPVSFCEMHLFGLIGSLLFWNVNAKEDSRGGMNNIVLH